MFKIEARAPFMGLSFFLCFILLLGACSDDDTQSGASSDCADGMVRNQLTGQCNYIGREGPNNPSANNPSANNPSANNPSAPDAGPSDDPDTTSPPACQEGTRRCANDTVEVCQGGAFVLSEACDATATCQQATCVPAGAVCAAGTTRCASVTAHETCSADGMGYQARVECGGGQVCENGQCVSGCNSAIGEKSNIGCQYLSLRLNQMNGARDQGHSVVVSNPGADPVTLSVTSPGIAGFSMADQQINPQQSAIVNFPTSPMINQAGLSDQIYVLNTSKPVIATQFAPLNNPGVGSETSDASLLLPTNTLGNEHVVLNWPGPPSVNIGIPVPGAPMPDTYIDVVAIRDGTTVQVSGPVALSGGAAGSMAANSSQTFTVPRSQVLHLSVDGGLFGGSGNTDLSGTIINSNYPVAVYVGATLVNIPDAPVASSPATGCAATGSGCALNAECCSGICGHDRESNSLKCMDTLKAADHIEQQLFPTNTWGRSYVATPFYSRGVNDFSIYKVTAARDNTVISIDPAVNGLSSVTLNRGDVHQFHSPDAFELEATDAIMVAQFMIGGQNSTLGMGDPAFLLPPAVEQFREDYVFLVPDQYAMNFVTLIAPTGVDIDLDGNTIAASTFTQVGGAGGWSYRIVESVAGGVHNASAAQPFGIIVHGMDDYISYAFSGGIILPD